MKGMVMGMGDLFKNLLSGDKKLKDNTRRLIIIIGIVGILLIAVSGMFNKKPKESSAVNAVLTADEYVGQLEERLSGIVTSIAGVGDARVMITLESGVEYVFANEERKNSDKTEDINNNSGSRRSERDDVQSSIIIVDSPGGGKQALVQTEIQPRVKGVVVVCTGGDSPQVRECVTDAITTALNISSMRVCVTKLSE